MLQYLVNFQMPQFFKKLNPAFLQTRRDRCRLVPRALTTTRESGEASREEGEDAILGPFAD